MHIKGRTLSLNEGKLSTSDVLYKSPKTSITQESETKTEEVIIVDETSQETNSTHEQQPVSEWNQKFILLFFKEMQWFCFT